MASNQFYWSCSKRPPLFCGQFLKSLLVMSFYVIGSDLNHKRFNSISLRSHLSHLVRETDKWNSLSYPLRTMRQKNVWAKLLVYWKLKLRNIFRGIHQLFMNIASSRDIQWILEKQKFLPWKATRSNDAREREAIGTRVLYVSKPSFNRNNGFPKASIYVWHHFSSLETIMYII